MSVHQKEIKLGNWKPDTHHSADIRTGAYLTYSVELDSFLSRLMILLQLGGDTP